MIERITTYGSEKDEYTKVVEHFTFDKEKNVIYKQTIVYLRSYFSKVEVSGPGFSKVEIVGRVVV